MQILPITQPAPVRLDEIAENKRIIIKRAIDNCVDDAADPGSGIIASESEQVCCDPASSLMEYQFGDSARRFILTNHYSNSYVIA